MIKKLSEDSSTFKDILNELLQKTIKEEESNPLLYHFIKNVLEVLDLQSNILYLFTSCSCKIRTSASLSIVNDWSQFSINCCNDSTA